VGTGWVAINVSRGDGEWEEDGASGGGERDVPIYQFLTSGLDDDQAN
jgi:hypothetical protein